MNRVLPTLFGSARHYKTGALYAFEWGDSSYGVAKMLRRDFGGIHVRIYANSWQERPTSVASETLGLPSLYEAERPGLGHVPMIASLFAKWEPTLIGSHTVSEDELVGYSEWKDAEGGYFGGPGDSGIQLPWISSI